MDGCSTVDGLDWMDGIEHQVVLGIEHLTYGANYCSETETICLIWTAHV